MNVHIHGPHAHAGSSSNSSQGCAKLTHHAFSQATPSHRTDCLYASAGSLVICPRRGHASLLTPQPSVLPCTVPSAARLLGGICLSYAKHVYACHASSNLHLSSFCLTPNTFRNTISTAKKKRIPKGLQLSRCWSGINQHSMMENHLRS